VEYTRREVNDRDNRRGSDSAVGSDAYLVGEDGECKGNQIALAILSGPNLAAKVMVLMEGTRADL